MSDLYPGLDIVKTFTHGGRAWALARRANGKCDLMRRGKDGVYRDAEGWHRTAREAWVHARKQWPEYVGNEETS